jgi:hypothetical protein
MASYELQMGDRVSLGRSEIARGAGRCLCCRLWQRKAGALPLPSSVARVAGLIPQESKAGKRQKSSLFFQ